MDYQEIRDFVINLLKKRLPAQLLYHNAEHTIHVLQMAEEFARGENVIDERELLVLRFAAIFHDTGFLFRLKKNENLGSEYARYILEKNGFDKELCNKVAQIILPTALPQTPNCKLSQILCDADLESLGNKDIFMHTSRCLRQELEFMNITFNKIEWVDFEIKFLNNHSYFTDYAKNTRNKNKMLFLQYFEEEKRRLLNG